MNDKNIRYDIGEPVSTEQPDGRAPDRLKAYRLDRKKSLIKLGAIGAFLIVMIIFASLGWFAKNKDTASDGMKVAISGPDYEILFLENGVNGIYYEDYHKLVQDPSAIVWQMAEANHMDNYSNDASNKGIHPGSCGVVSFCVKPLVDSVDLNFTFDVLGYTYDEANGMTQLTSNQAPSLFLNGHILLFEKRTGTEDNYIYSKPILSDEDMDRVIKGKTYSGKNTLTTVDIYWVWPRTLSTLIDAKNCTKISVTETPFTSTETGSGTSVSTSAYSDVVDNIRTYPDFYCKGVSRPDDDQSRPTESTIVANYDKYGDYYDQADNDIGMGVDFLLLKLYVSKASSGGE